MTLQSHSPEAIHGFVRSSHREPHASAPNSNHPSSRWCVKRTGSLNSFCQIPTSHSLLHICLICHRSHSRCHHHCRRSQSLPSQGPDACSHPGATALIPLSAFQLHGDTFVAATQPRHHSQGQSGKRC